MTSDAVLEEEPYPVVGPQTTLEFDDWSVVQVMVAAVVVGVPEEMLLGRAASRLRAS